jgi:hypothetical protein
VLSSPGRLECCRCALTNPDDCVGAQCFEGCDICWTPLAVHVTNYCHANTLMMLLLGGTRCCRCCCHPAAARKVLPRMP